MNGVHDLGGMDGFTLPVRDQGFALHEDWERNLWGLIFALRPVPGTGGGSRAYLERMPPVLYLSYPYYGKWLHVREQILIDNGVVTAEELANPEGPLNEFALPPGYRLPSPAQIVESLANDTSALLESDIAPRFTVGDNVLARNEHPPGHTRMPRYVRGHVGTIVTRHGPHRFQDDLPDGVELGPQHLYTVAFSATELWGDRGHANDTIHVELWDYHLEAA